MLLLCCFGVSKMPFGGHLQAKMGPRVRLAALFSLPSWLLHLSIHVPVHHPHGIYCFAFRGFKCAVWTACLRTKMARLGLESCWGLTFRMCRLQRFSPFQAGFFTCPSACPSTIHIHAFADENGTPWARILLGFGCFAWVAHECRLQRFSDAWVLIKIISSRNGHS